MGWIFEELSLPKLILLGITLMVVAAVFFLGLFLLFGARHRSVACPYCAERIKPAAVVCRFCGRQVVPPKV
jgi:hypothetical protein